MGERITIKDVFIQCQTGMQSHGKLITTLSKIYEKTEFPSFWSEFQHYLKYAMIIFKREPAVERLIDFVSKFVPALSKKIEEEGDDGNESDHDDVSDNKLLQELFDFLLQSHSARDRAVRFRCCQLINKLLTNLGVEAQIDDELYDKLYECMLDRLKDKWPVVRYHAVMAMSRLQDPSDENCPVIKAFLFLLNCDPNFEVRRAVLTCIAPSTKTLSSIIGRTRDVKETVRKVAYEVLSEKIHIKALSIALRLQLVNEGLSDRSEMVKNACSGKLLQAWLRTFGGNILDLLKSLDVEDSTDICSLVLKTLFTTSNPQELVEKFDILNDSLLVPVEQLNCESALYWQAVCKYIHDMGNDGDEYMEKVIPTCVDYCAYVQNYIADLKNVDDPEIQLSREFIIEHLLMIASYMDTADQASRKALEQLLHNMLMADHVSHRLVKLVVTRICDLKGTTEALIPYLAETVSEIREPISIVEKDIAAEERRQVNLKVASVRVQLNQLREDLDGAVKSQDFARANEIKMQIAELDAEKVRLLESTEVVTEEVRTERNDPQTILKCQTIISEMLQILKLSSISPTLQMMIESQILPGIQNEDPEVRNMAMRALGLCCYLSKDLLVSYIPLFMQASQIDVEGVRVTALQVLFDLLHIYGLEIVDANDGSEETSSSSDSGEPLSSSSESKNSDKNGAASKLVAIICSLLDGENSELRTCAAEGLAKLLLSGRIVSSKILSHLILLWYNPLSEDDTHLRDCLGTFFPLFALAGRSNQEVVEEAFLPTLKTLLNAPGSSPLQEVDVNNVAELLVQLTNTKLITQNQNKEDTNQDNPGHDNLSEKVCNEVLSSPDSSATKLWVKILNQMEVSPDNEVVLKDLRILCYKMVKLVKDKPSLRSLQKFQTTVNEMASKFVTNDDDLENIEIEPVAMDQEVEDTEEEVMEEEVPKKKRVRRLHTQNLTLGLDSESELDITEGETIEVDASCLERRVSSASDTPARKMKKNTSSSVMTELAAEDEVFCVPEVPASRKRISLEPKDSEAPNEATGSEVEQATEGEVTESSIDEKTPEESKEDETKEDEVREKIDKPTKKNVKTPTKDTPNAQVDENDKAKDAKNSPVKDKDTEGTSPRRSLEKRKSRSESDTGIPAKSPKRPADKSPEKSEGATKSPRKSLDKSPSKSPGTAKAVAKSPAKAVAKSPVRTVAKSPAKTVAKSPVSRKSTRSVDKASPVKGKPSSAAAGAKQKEKAGDAKSPRRDLEKRKTRKDDGEIPAKSPRRTDKSSSSADESPLENKGKTEDKRKTRTEKSSETAAKSPRTTKEKLQRSNNVSDKSPRMNLEKVALKHKAEILKQKGKQAPASAVGKQDTRKPSGSTTVKSPDSRSPANVRTARNRTASDAKDKVAPRTARTSSQVKVSEAQEPKSPRQTRRASSQVVVDTPEPKSPSSIRNRAQRSVAETPELKSPRPSRKPSGKVASNTPETGARNIQKPQDKDKTKQTGKTDVRGQTKSATAVTGKTGRMSRTEKGKMGSSDESSAVSSPEAPAAKKSKTVSSVAVKKAVVVDEESDDEGQLRRKARPSRKSATGDPATIKSPLGRSSRSTPARSELKSPKEGKEIKETSTRRARGSISVTSPSTSQRTPSSVASSAAKSSQSSVTSKTHSTRRSGASKAASTPRSQTSESGLEDSVFSTPSSAAPRTRSALSAAHDANTRSTRSKPQEAPKQNLEKKLRDAGKRPATKTLPSRSKTARK